MTNALAIIDTKNYVALNGGANVGELIAENLGGDRLDEFDLPQIKVPSGGGANWSVPTIGGEESFPSIEGIIVHVAARRSYWAGSDPDGSPPDCSSRDTVTGVGDPGGACDTCPMNAFGSAHNERGKACNEQRAVFLLRKDSMLPVVVTVPSGSLKNFKRYMMGLAASGMQYRSVVTRLSLNKTKNKDGVAYAEIAPSLVGTVAAGSAEAVAAYAGGMRKALATIR